MATDPPEKNKRQASQEERELWHEMTLDVTPLDSSKSHAFSSNSGAENDTDKGPDHTCKELLHSRKTGAKTSASAQDLHVLQGKMGQTRHVASLPLMGTAGGTDTNNGAQHQLDHRTQERLRKGKINIDLTLDLHGLNQAEAHAALNQAVTNAYHHNLRCLLVITGKGNKERLHNPFSSGHRGVLKQRVPEWLNQEPLKSMTLQTQPARPQHGGDGALYLYIKRKRNA